MSEMQQQMHNVASCTDSGTGDQQVQSSAPACVAHRESLPPLCRLP